MNKSNLFKLAHMLTKATIQAGDSYQVTFGAAIKHINSINSIKGTEKQLVWADKIIAEIIVALKNAQSDSLNHFYNKCVNTIALPVCTAILNKGIAYFINKYASMSFNELITLVSHKTYKDMRHDVWTLVTKSVIKNVQKKEIKLQAKLLK